MGARDFIKNNSRFIKFEDGVPIIMDIISHKESVDMNGNDSMSYKVQVQGEDKEKIMQSGSVGLARQIVALPDEGEGHRVKITRTGKGFDTTYEVVLMSFTYDPNKPVEPQELREPEEVGNPFKPEDTI